MKLKIGFRGYEKEENTNMHVTEPVVAAPVKSVVQVRFPSDGRSFAYYNDGFDLKVGDVVTNGQRHCQFTFLCFGG